MRKITLDTKCDPGSQAEHQPELMNVLVLAQAACRELLSAVEAGRINRTDYATLSDLADNLHTLTSARMEAEDNGGAWPDLA